MQGPEGPTGITGMFGPQGNGPRGPTGPTGPTGIARFGFENVTGPTGWGGPAGPVVPRSLGTGTQIATYTGGTASANIDVNPSTLWSAPIPADIRGKSGLLSVYMDLSVNYIVPPTTSFDFGFFADDVSLAMGGSAYQRYIQTVPQRFLFSRNGIPLGNNVCLPGRPFQIPVTLNPNANELRIRTANASSPLNSLVVSNQSNFTTPGLTAYTTPAGSIGVLAYVWGGGGAPFDVNPGGPGGFSFGYYVCPAGTALGVIVGGLGTNTFNTGFGGPGSNSVGSNGGGGGFSGVFLGSSPTSNASTPLVVAGGGGGCSVQGTGSNFQWVGGGGGGLIGDAPYSWFQAVFETNSAGLGGTQSAGNSQWGGQGYNTHTGASGGGWWGGRSWGNQNPGRAGSGGSAFLAGALTRSYTSPPNTYRSVIGMGTASNVVWAPRADVMRDLGLAPTTHAHGGGGVGCVVLIPVTATTTPSISVDARFTTF